MLNIEHTIEQLEACRRDHLKGTAVKIIRQHLQAAKKQPTIRACEKLTYHFFENPEQAKELIINWKLS